MKGSSQAALALAAGYVLGRRHKLRTATLLAGAVATGRLGALGGAAVKRGAKGTGVGGMLGTVAPQLSGIAGTVRGELANAGKAAAMSMVNNRIESFSDSLHQRTEALRSSHAPDKSTDDGNQEQDEEPGRDTDDLAEPEDRAGRDGAGEEAGDEQDDEAGDSYDAEDPYDEDEEADDGDRADRQDDDEAAGVPERRSARPRRSPVTRAGR